jgi:dGTPase
MSDYGGFDHNLHALRIVEQFEQRYLEFPGLNLTFEVREGIIKHSRDYAESRYPELAEYLLDQRPPLEAQLIDWVDEIAYNTADLDDAREAEVLDLKLLLREVPVFESEFREVQRLYPEGREKLQFNEALKRVLNILTTNLIATTQQKVSAAGIRTVEDIRRSPKRLALLDDGAAAQNACLKQFLFAHIYNHPAITQERDRSVRCLEELFRFYDDTPGSMPPSHEELTQSSPRALVVCDYIAGMTDQFLLKQHRRQFGD